MQDRPRLIDSLFTSCLFLDGEPTQGAVLADGITARFGFHPERLQAAVPELRALVGCTVPDAFMSDIGGGASFLDLAFDRVGCHWAEHPTLQQLVVMCIAAGLADYCLPRDMWAVLPGGVPYVAFHPPVQAGPQVG